MSESQLTTARPSAKGPWTLIVIGAVALLLAVAVGVVSAVFAARAMPLGILTLGGEPGSDVLVVVEAPGTGHVELAADTEYGLMLVVPASQAPGRLGDHIDVTGPGGEALAVSSGASINLTVANGGQSGHVVGSVRPTTTGTHELTVPEPVGSGTARVFVAELPETGTFVAGIFGGVVGFIAAVFLGITGVGLLCGGLIWRVLRRGASPPPRQSAVAPPLH